MKYIFLHVSKTAGTSFRETVIEKNTKSVSFYQKDLSNILNKDNYNIPKSLSTKFEDILKNDSFCAHMTHGLHNLLPNDDYNYITILRNPINRVISHFNYDIDRGSYKGDNIFDWLDFKSSGQHNTRHISIIGSMHEKDLKTKYELAIENVLDEKTIFGFTEKYDEFLTIVNERYGWEVENTFKNVSKHKVNLSNADIKKLEELCEYDIKFYNECEKIYKNKF